MYKVYLDGENLDPDYGRVIVDSTLVSTWSEAMYRAKDFLKIIDIGRVVIIVSDNVVWEQKKDLECKAEKEAKSYGGVFEKGNHTIYLYENNWEYAPMVSMSSWTSSTTPETVREWVDTTGQSKDLREKLEEILVSNGYKLTRK